ncbi:MAG TPA: hypothetical protein VGC66_03805 [Pyrinomonadaceae bacterium]|jgi:hypothetical protein
MKYCTRPALLLLILLAFTTAAASAQETASAQQSVENLRSQLLDIEAKQATLEARVRQLDEDLRPENIERSLALTGSTRPEELREQRRQQLAKEKAGVQAQLDQLATSRARTQAALTTAETVAYQQSAVVNATTTSQQQTSAGGTGTQPARTVQPQPRSTRRRTRRARVRRRTP